VYIRLSIFNFITMKNISIFFVLLFVLQLTIHAQSEDKLSIMFMGDIMGHDSQINSAYNPKTKQYEYLECFDFIKDILSKPDITIANLEVTLAGAPYKGYPAFSSPDALAKALKDAGVDAMVTANNHSCDRGRKGIIRTLDMLDSLKIPHTGTFRNRTEKENNNPLLIEKNGFKICLLNYTYGTNGVKVPAPTKVNLIDRQQIQKDISKAKTLKPDILIVFYHWGKEYQSQPNKSQIALYNLCKKNGVDVVIGSHPHVLQKMEWNKESIQNDLVVYSLGNFVSNQRKRKTDGGAIVEIEFTKTENETRISNAGHYLTWVYTPVFKGKKKFYILPASQYENYPQFFITKEHYEKMQVFISDSRNLLKKSNLNFPEFTYQANSGKWQLK